MGILFNEVVFNESEVKDFDDDTLNGGGKGAIILNDQLNNVFPEVSASDRQAGVVRRTKVFVSNNSTDRTMDQTIIHMKQNVLSPDNMLIYDATENPWYHFNFTTDQDGSSTTVTAGTELDITSIDPASAVAGDFVGRKFSFDGHTYTVNAAPTDASIEFAEDITTDILSTDMMQTSDNFDFTESDEDFGTSKKHANVGLSAAVMNGEDFVLIPDANEAYFEIDDDIILGNEYYQAVFRGKVQAKEVYSEDNTLHKITLDNPYYGNTIPALKGAISNGVKTTIKNGITKSFWMEMTVQPEATIQAELISQFQIGLHFDDIATA